MHLFRKCWTTKLLINLSNSQPFQKKIEQSKKWRDEHRDQYNANERARKEFKKNSQIKKE